MQSEIFQAFICYNFEPNDVQFLKTPNSKFQKIRILHEINKKSILNKDMLALRKG